MTVAEAGEIFDYWAENPPSHLMLQIIARAVGWKPVEAASLPGLAGLAAAAPPGLVVAPGGNGGFPPPVFDVDALRARNRARAAGTEPGDGARAAEI